MKRSHGLFTLTLQKPRMPQIQGVEGDAVVIYREPSTTKEMRYHRLSQRVNNVAIFLSFWMSLPVNSWFTENTGKFS